MDIGLRTKKNVLLKKKNKKKSAGTPLLWMKTNNEYLNTCALKEWNVIYCFFDEYVSTVKTKCCGVRVKNFGSKCIFISTFGCLDGNTCIFEYLESCKTSNVYVGVNRLAIRDIIVQTGINKSCKISLKS